MGTILIVEDEKPIREFIAINLKREKYEVLEAASGEDALTILAKEGIDLGHLSENPLHFNGEDSRFFL